MSGLFLKDLMSLRQYGKSLLLIILVWLALGFMNKSSDFLGGAMMMFMPIIPMSAMAYDEKAKWDRYALTMPVSRADLVLSKYALSIIAGVFSGIVFLIVAFINGEPLADVTMRAVVYFCIGTLITSVTMPIIFKLGTERGRIACMAVYIIPFAGILLLSKMGVKITTQTLQSLEKFVWLVPVAALVILALSAMLATKICKKKEY